MPPGFVCDLLSDPYTDKPVYCIITNILNWNLSIHQLQYNAVNTNYLSAS